MVVGDCFRREIFWGVGGQFMDNAATQQSVAGRSRLRLRRWRCA